MTQIANLTPLQQAMAQLRAQAQAQAAQITSLQAALQQLSAGGGVQGTTNYPNTLILPFIYQFPTFTLNAAASGDQTLQMSSDSAFELQRITCTTSADNPTDFGPNYFSAQLVDQSTGRQLSNFNIDQASLCTRSYQYGNDQKYPVLFPAQCIIQGKFTNLLPGLAITIKFCLEGYKIYQVKPAGS